MLLVMREHINTGMIEKHDCEANAIHRILRINMISIVKYNLISNYCCYVIFKMNI